MQVENQVIANKARGVVAESRFTQQQVAETLGISRTSVVERFSGRVPFSAPEILALSRATGAPIERFFPDDSGARRSESALAAEEFAS